MLPKFNNTDALRFYSKQKITGTFCKTVARIESFSMSTELFKISHHTNLTFHLQWVIDYSCNHNIPQRQLCCFEFS